MVVMCHRYLREHQAEPAYAKDVARAAYSGKPDLNAFTVGAPTTIKKLEIWKLQPTNQGFREAQKNRIWEPDTK